MTKHTSGPWKEWPGNLSSISIRGGPNMFAVCACRFKGPDGRITSESIAEGKANARLIAAAPDMLAALKRALRHLGEQSLSEIDARREVLAAIAKATGGEP